MTNEILIKPASFTKQKKPSTIPLNKQTLEILTEMKNEILFEMNLEKLTSILKECAEVRFLRLL